MKISRLKTMTIPKIAVLATALAVGLAVATVDMRPAEALPTFGVNCSTSGCHTAGGSVSAIPSTTTPASGAAFTVAIALTNAATGNSGYNISLAGASVTTGGPAAGKTFTANLTAPAAAGTYVYTVAADTAAPPGAASSTTFTVTVASTGTTTTPPVTTTTPPVTTTTPPVTTTTTVAPAVVPAGAPATGAGGAGAGNGPLMGLGGLALLLSGAAMVTVIRRRRQV